MRRFLCILLAALMCLPVSALADEDIIIMEWLEEPELEVIELVPEEPAITVELEAEETVHEITLEAEPIQEVAQQAALEVREQREEAPVLYSDLTLGTAYAMADQRAITWQVEAWNGKAPFSISTWVTLDGAVVYSAVEGLDADGAVSFSFLPERFGVHTVHAVIQDEAGNAQTHEASLPVSVDEYETELTWEKSVRDVALTGDWARDLVAIARSQLGYMESERNFVIDKNGFVHGFTRYGAWYGAAYANWCAMFVSFCMYYAGIPSDQVPYEAGCEAWIKKFSSLDVYHTKQYQPRPGDIVFLTFEENSHVGIVATVDGDAFSTIEGNVGKSVVRHDYHLSDAEVEGFADLHALMARAGLTEVDSVVEVAMVTEPEQTEAPRLIVYQPESREVAVLGDEVVFSALVAEGVRCRWQISDGGEWRDLTDSNTLSGAESDTLRLLSSETRAGRAYRLAAENGQYAEISDTVTFRVREKVIAQEVAFDRQPHDAVIAALGDEVVFTARAAGASYQWQYNNGSGWKNLTESATWHGVDTDTLRFISSALRLDCQYRVVATGEAGVRVSNRVTFSLAGTEQ